MRGFRRLKTVSSSSAIGRTTRCPSSSARWRTAYPASRHPVASTPSSRKEEFGLSLLEALAAGLPVVAPDRGGPPTFVEDGKTGFLADTTDLAALRTGLRRAASVRLDEARAARARSRVEQDFTIDAMAGRLVELYEHVTRRPALRAA